MQKTFIEYVTEKRIEKAKKLLRQTDKPSGEIAREVGYRDSHYFKFCFPKASGMQSQGVTGQSVSRLFRILSGTGFS